MSAYFLNQSGLKTVVVERGRVGSGASYGNAGFIVPTMTGPPRAFSNPFSVFMSSLRRDSPIRLNPFASPNPIPWALAFMRNSGKSSHGEAAEALRNLARESFELTRQIIQKEGIDCEYHERGIMQVYLTNGAFDQEIRKLDESSVNHGSVKVLSSSEARALVPALSPRISGATLSKRSAWLHPSKILLGLEAALKKKGVEILSNFEVRKFESRGSRFDEVSNGVRGVKAKWFILATGAWSRFHTQDLGASIPIYPGKGYTLTLRGQGKLSDIPMLLEELRIAVSQTVDTNIRVGGIFELNGYGEKFEKKRLQWILKGATKYIPSIENMALLESWMGLRPCTPDGLPVIGKIPGLENSIVATGHCRLGLTLAAGTGRHVANMITGREAPTLYELFNPSRFQRS